MCKLSKLPRGIVFFSLLAASTWLTAEIVDDLTYRVGNELRYIKNQLIDEALGRAIDG